MRTYINENKVTLTQCTAKDIIKAMKGLEMLNQEPTRVLIEGTFDFDTKYHRRYTESQVNDMFRKLRTSQTAVTIDNNRLYMDGIVIPDSEITVAEIYFKLV